MAQVRVLRESGKISVLSPFEYKDVLGTVPTREWDPKKRHWRFAATPHVASSLLTEIYNRATSLGDEVVVDQMTLDLVTNCVRVDAFVERFAEVAVGKSPGTKFAPWRHQWIGSRLIRELPAVYLAWEMGCGKTKGVIDAVVDLHAGHPRKVLIVAPSSVVEVWGNEIPKHVEDPDSMFVVSASMNRQVKKRVAAAAAALELARQTFRTLVIVANYESFTLDTSPFLAFVREIAWDLLVLDEAQRISTPGTKTTKAMTEKIGPMARRRVCLSGTPMRNSPLDLYSQCKFLDPGIFGSNKAQFLERYAVLDFWGDVVGLQNLEDLADRFGAIAYRIDKRKVLDLPPCPPPQIRRFDLSDEAKKIYDAFETDLVVGLESGKVVAGNALVQLLRAQQMTSGYVPTETENGGEIIEEIDAGKIGELSEVLDEISPEEPVVVFCRFVRDLDRIRDLANEKKRGYYELSGRVNELKAWQASNGGEVIGIQIKAGGVGVDATRSSYVVFYSVGFSLADYEQALARLDRPGQTRPVTAVNLVARGTVDEAVFGSIGSKKDVVEGVLDYLRGKKKGGSK